MTGITSLRNRISYLERMLVHATTQGVKEDEQTFKDIREALELARSKRLTLSREKAKKGREDK